MAHCNHTGTPEAGKKAPDRSQMGIRIRFMIAWNPWVESIRHAITSPRLVRPKATRNITPAAARAETTVSEMPAAGARRSKRTPWSSAKVAPPSA